MVKVEKSRVIRAGVDRVWEILADPESDRKLFKNIRDIKISSANGNTIEKEATVGPSGFRQKTRQTLLVIPKTSMRLSITDESISGERVITLSSQEGGSGDDHATRVDVAWDLKLKGVPGFVNSVVKGQISKITEEGLDKVAELAEGGTKPGQGTREKEASP